MLKVSGIILILLTFFIFVSAGRVWNILKVKNQDWRFDFVKKITYFKY